MYLIVFSVRGMMTCSLERVSSSLFLTYSDNVHGIHTAVDHLDDLVEDDKGSLQTRQLYQCFDGARIRLPAALDLLATLAQTSQGKVVVGLDGVALELGQEDTGYVLLLGAHTEAGLLGRLLDLVANVAADGIGYLCEREGGDLHDAAHFALGFIDAACDFWSVLAWGRGCQGQDVVAPRKRLCAVGQPVEDWRGGPWRVSMPTLSEPRSSS